MLGLRFCARAFSSCGKRGPLFIVVRGPLTIAASLVAEHRLQTRRLSSCGSRAYLLRDMWDLPRPGLEPVSPALAGRFSTTAPPGKPLFNYLSCTFLFEKDLKGLRGEYRHLKFNEQEHLIFFFPPNQEEGEQGSWGQQPTSITRVSVSCVGSPFPPHLPVPPDLGERTVSGGLKQDLSSLPRNWS